MTDEDRAFLSHIEARMTAADRALARMLFSMERYGEPAAPEAKSEPTPPIFAFLAFNLRAPRNRSALAAALAQPAA